MTNGTDSSVAATLSAFAMGYCIVAWPLCSYDLHLLAIFKKTGQNGAMSLITLIPGVGLLCRTLYPGLWQNGPLRLRQNSIV